MSIASSKPTHSLDTQKTKQKFTGLTNQGATCYMNSLLQSLYMTPELRKKVYEWTFNNLIHDEKENCILYQLQVLFGKMQLSKRLFIDTVNLTKSFGWDIREGYQQHDAQEFCRVLFEAIETSVKFTESEGLVSSLYEGYLTDYVKCLSCNTESKRSDQFLDLSLTVRNDFEKIKNESLEKALFNYTRPELLTADNQYMCKICGKKVDALKGLKIEKLPYILVTQIKRFDLNYETFTRIKLNDRVSFPLVLNCNSFLGDFHEMDIKGAEDLQEEKIYISPMLKFETPQGIDLKSQVKTGYELLTEDKDKRPLMPDNIVKDRVLFEQTEKRKQTQEQLIKLYQKDGEFVYELFSIMNHSGLAMSGHYFAYIKSFEDSKWYNFNDSTVKEIDEKEILKVFGGEGGMNLANAYLLMYRKICGENLVTVADEDIPKYLLEEIKTQVENENKVEGLKNEKSRIIHLKVNFEKKETVFETFRDKTLKEFKLEVMSQLRIGEDPENVRLRSFNSVYEMLQDTFDEEKLISACQVWDYKVFGIEKKNSAEVWQPYNQNLITVKVHVWDNSIINTSQPASTLMQIDKRSNGHNLIQILSSKFSLEPTSLLLFKKVYSSLSVSSDFLSNKDLSQSLLNLKVYENAQLYIEEKTEAKPKWPDFIEIEARRYTIRFNHPDDSIKNFSSPDCCHSVMIDQQSSLFELKSLISEKIQIPSLEFLMKRGNSQGQEIKDLSLNLIQVNLMNNSLIVIERGAPSSINEFRIQFSLVVKPKSECNKSVCDIFIGLFELPIDSNKQVIDIKYYLCDKIKEMFPSFHIDPFKMRLRERNSERMTKCLRNSEMMKTYHLHEKKQLVLQVLENEEEEILPNMMIACCKRWSPDTWEISEPQEFIVARRSTMAEIGEIFSQFYGIDVRFS